MIADLPVPKQARLSKDIVRKLDFLRKKALPLLRGEPGEIEVGWFKVKYFLIWNEDRRADLHIVDIENICKDIFANKFYEWTKDSLNSVNFIEIILMEERSNLAFNDILNSFNKRIQAICTDFDKINAPFAEPMVDWYCHILHPLEKKLKTGFNVWGGPAENLKYWKMRSKNGL